MNRLAVFSVVGAALAVTSCTKDKQGEVTTTAAQPTGTTMAGGAAKAEAPAPPDAPAVVWKDIGLVTPESVLYDAAADQYLVSNINGDPLAADGNGFISRLTPDGKVAELEWIASKKGGVTLNAPKGMTFAGEHLYVTDIDTVRIFDKKTGAPAGEVKVPGAAFMNDLATTPDGRVLASDTGVRAGKESFTPSGTDAVYAIDKDRKLTTLSKSDALGGPNGLLPLAGQTWVLGFRSGEIYTLDDKGGRGNVQKLPKGSPDGIVALPNGEVLVSSWDASGVFRGKPGGDFSIIVAGVKAPADIGYDTKRARLLVPLFHDNEVRAYVVK